jgi:hypothetical protein
VNFAGIISVSPRTRFLLICVLPVLYISVAAVQNSTNSRSPLIALVALPFVIFFTFRWTDLQPMEVDQVGEIPRQSFRLLVTGACGYFASRLAGPGHANLDGAAAICVGLTSMSALVALARVPQAPGLMRCPESARRLDAVFFLGLLTIIAATLPFTFYYFPERGAQIDPLTIDYALTAQGAAAVFLVALSTLRFRLQRRLELGVAERGSAAFALTATLLLVAVPASALRLAPADRVLPISAVLASVCIGITTVVPDATLVGRSLRVILVTCLFGAPVALISAGIANNVPKYAGASVLIASVGLLLMGVLSHRMAARLLPQSSRWIRALERAQISATLAEPGAALNATISTIRDQLGPSVPSPVLFRLETNDQLTVDRAGYLHVSEGTVPDNLITFCAEEVHHTLRLDVARALEVRRPDIRPILMWMEAQSFVTVTTLRNEDGPVGVVAMPKAGRKLAISLDEINAVGRLSDRVTSVLALSGSLELTRQRQLKLEATIEQLQSNIDRLKQTLYLEGSRHTTQTRLLAQRANAGRYSPASRLLEQELSQLADAQLPAIFLTPPGVRTETYAAAVHLISPRKEKAFVIIDCAETRNHALGLWQEHETSPLSLAEEGTLLLLDMHTLPLLVQNYLARIIYEQRTIPVEQQRHHVLVWGSVRQPIEALIQRHVLSELLADALGYRTLTLPSLAQRAEDMRSLTLDVLAKTGLALKGEPWGIAPAALQELLEYPWPANESELELVLLRAALVARGKVVTLRDLLKSGFPPIHTDPPSVLPIDTTHEH